MKALFVIHEDSLNRILKVLLQVTVVVIAVYSIV